VAGSGTTRGHTVAEAHSYVPDSTEMSAIPMARHVIYPSSAATPQPEPAMSSRLAAVLAATLVPALATTASAQGAPGDCDDCYAAPAAPVVLVRAPELSHRFGVGLHVASLAIADRNDPNADPTQLGGGGLQLRYRLTPRWELELGMSALREQTPDGMPTGPELQVGTLGALFHMRPGRRWDWYLVGAIGGIHEGTRNDGTDHQARALAELGIGLERRWSHLSVGVELRGVGIAPQQQDQAQPGVTLGAAAKTSSPTPAPSTDSRGDAGAQFSVAATYYF